MSHCCSCPCCSCPCCRRGHVCEVVNPYLTRLHPHRFVNHRSINPLIHQTHEPTNSPVYPEFRNKGTQQEGDESTGPNHDPRQGGSREKSSQGCYCSHQYCQTNQQNQRRYHQRQRYRQRRSHAASHLHSIPSQQQQLPNQQQTKAQPPSSNFRRRETRRLPTQPRSNAPRRIASHTPLHSLCRRAPTALPRTLAHKQHCFRRESLPKAQSGRVLLCFVVQPLAQAAQDLPCC
jgi:hypothetical protein